MEHGRSSNNRRIDVASGLGRIIEESRANTTQRSALQLNDGIGAPIRINRPLYLSNQIFPSASMGGAALRRAEVPPGLCMLPANIIRLMHRALSPRATISEDSKVAVQECFSEFLSLITREADEKCKAERRRTITAEDVLSALSRLGFENYVGPLSLYLQRYRESEAAAHGGGSCLGHVGSSTGMNGSSSTGIGDSVGGSSSISIFRIWNAERRLGRSRRRRKNREDELFF